MSSDNKQKCLSRCEFVKFGADGAGGLAAASTPLLAAAKNATRRYAQGNPTVVRWWTWYIEQQDEYPKIIADFEAKNPNINIDLQLKTPADAYLPALLAAAASGNVDDMPEIY